MRLNDLDFHVEIEGSGPAVLLLHGFTGSVRAWDEVRPALAHSATLIGVDLIGHGHSAAPADPARYTLDWSVRDLTALCDALGFEEVDVLGYSMGGRVALHFALHAPRRVRRLILESASPGIEDDAERSRRLASDDALAERILSDGIEAFVAEWEALSLLAPAAHVSAPKRAQQHAHRLRNNPLGLANSLRGMGTGRQTPLWSVLHTLRAPVQLVVGESDPRYRDIAERMRSRLSHAELAVVGGAGHTVHLDQPDEFVALVSDALDSKLTHRAARC
jgi:2-succinyl-6-hydroxy-2,4-cyclohexadiene-1-carboxylate synthase